MESIVRTPQFSLRFYFPENLKLPPGDSVSWSLEFLWILPPVFPDISTKDLVFEEISTRPWQLFLKRIKKVTVFFQKGINLSSKKYCVQQKPTISWRVPNRFWWFLRRLKAFDFRFQTAQKWSKTVRNSPRYGRFLVNTISCFWRHVFVLRGHL